MPLLKYLGWGAGSPPDSEDDGHAVRALPANWYTSPEMYELERRAIFSRKWQLITHSNRLKKPGDWLSFTVAGFGFIVAKDRKGVIRSFKNICRHRAYPVVTGDSGCNQIFSCKYHGWSYSLDGKLTKAPGYQELASFDKSQNGLLPNHVHIDKCGFIWVNLEAKPEPEMRWEDEFSGVDEQERYDQFDFDDYEFDHFWEMESKANWKEGVNNYNECLHCTTCHPTIGALANLQSYSVNTKNLTQIIHNPATTPEQKEAGLTVASTYYFPNITTNVTPHFFMIQRFVPTDVGTTLMQYQVFRNKNATDEQFNFVSNTYKQIMNEDRELCDAAQKNLLSDVFMNGELHPRLEKGPIYFQKSCREVVTAHHKREQAAKKEIWPARMETPKSTNGGHLSTQKDFDFCAGLKSECPATTQQEVLSW